MVRVISLHHFTSQTIQTVEQPTACTIAPPNRLLLALTSNCIEVHPLDAPLPAGPLFSLPTVDSVRQLVHARNGNYLATLESASGARPARAARSVRVYLNWDGVATLQQSKMTSGRVTIGASECGMLQPMRARIAGRVTPATSRPELTSLEMIEVPLPSNPLAIAVCQTTGNLATLARRSLTIHQLADEPHPISKLRFIDFREADFALELSFDASSVALAESYVAVWSRTAFYLAQLVAAAPPPAPPPPPPTADFRAAGQTLHLPSIARDNSPVHRSNPSAVADRDLLATVSPPRARLLHLVQLRLTTADDEFRAVALRPLHVRERAAAPAAPLGGRFHAHLAGCLAVAATAQEAYHYACDVREPRPAATVHPFTAPALAVALEGHFLHALTDAGLETYTLGGAPVCLAGLRAFAGGERLLAAEGCEWLVLLASAGVSPTHSAGSGGSATAAYWTAYALGLPDARAVFGEVRAVAEALRFSAPQTYAHLVGGAHMGLREALVGARWQGGEGGFVEMAAVGEGVAETYRVSCALLGDHYVMCEAREEYELAVAYYKMAQLQPGDVMRRVRKVQKQANNQNNNGLLFYLKCILLESKQNYWELEKLYTDGNRQNFAESLLQLFETTNFDELPHLILKSTVLRECSTDRLIHILSQKKYKNGKEDERKLALVVLTIQKSDYEAANRWFSELKSLNLENLLILHWELLFEFNQTAKNCKKSMSFSDFSSFLFANDADLLSSVLTVLINGKKLALHKFLKVFLEYLPISTGKEASTVLQRTLEQYFAQNFTKLDDINKLLYERGATDALKLLVRSYLSQLQLFQLKETKIQSDQQIYENGSEDSKWFFDDCKKQQVETYLFADYRFEYLNRMAPFQVEITSKLYEATFDGGKTSNYDGEHQNGDADLVLKKLQAILASPLCTKQITSEVNAFLSLNETLRGSFSLQTIVMNVNDAILLLIDVCPQSLLQFGKDRFQRTDEWKFLIATLQRRIMRLGREKVLNRVCFFHKKLLNDVLTHVATSMTLDQLVQVFPQRLSTSEDENRVGDENWGIMENEMDLLNEIQNYEPFVVVCKETMHANQINKLITTTGQQLLCTLNL